jgi:hypothetical protein
MIETKKKKTEFEFELNREYNCKIKDFYSYLEKNEGTFEILTPTGFEKIGDVYKKFSKKIFKIDLQNGMTLTGSEDHLVLLDTSKNNDQEINDNIEILDNNTWVRLSNIRNTDWVITKDGSFKIDNINFLGIDDTYDLEVLTNSHSYFSNDIISHNTGKTSISEALAQRIVERKCSRVLFNKRIVTLDLASMVAGTKYRGQFEERVKSLMQELEKNPDVILFIDEIHTMIGAGGTSGSLDASNMFKPALARGEIQIIGATTLDEYRKHIEKDGALERRFQKVVIEPATPEETIQILNNIKENYEDHHSVIYTEEAINACVELTSRYIPDRFLPDKAIDALDESGARVHISNIVVPKEIKDIEDKLEEIKNKKGEVIRNQRFEEAARLRDVEKQLNKELESSRKKWEEESKNNRQVVTEENVAEVVSLMTGIPVTKVSENENTKLQKMTDVIKSKVIGQEDAVNRIVRAIQRGRMGLKDPNKPVLVSMLIGSSGTGKCVTGETLVKLKNKKTGRIEEISINDFIKGL